MTGTKYPAFLGGNGRGGEKTCKMIATGQVEQGAGQKANLRPVGTSPYKLVNFAPGDTVDVVYRLGRNYFQNTESLQLTVVDLKR